MDRNRRYAPNGTVFYKDTGTEKHWVVQASHLGGYGGAPFKTVLWATWFNSHMPFTFQETNEDIDMSGWVISQPADVVLYGTKDIIDNLEKIQALIRLGYKGQHQTKQDLIDELQWRMSQ